MPKLPLLNPDDFVAIDIHTHAEEPCGLHADDGYDDFQERMAEYFKSPNKHPPTVQETAAYYRAKKIAAVIFPVDAINWKITTSTLCLTDPEMTGIDRDETHDHGSGAQDQNDEDGTIQKPGPGLHWRFDDPAVFLCIRCSMNVRNNASWNLTFRPRTNRPKWAFARFLGRPCDCDSGCGSTRHPHPFGCPASHLEVLCNLWSGQAIEDTLSGHTALTRHFDPPMHEIDLAGGMRIRVDAHHAAQLKRTAMPAPVQIETPGIGVDLYHNVMLPTGL